ncbi:MAG: response regulator [Desulfovibrionaceae bacterium]|nr:response regulator [Desulfovibrionaceae bacterium]MBF0512902.1 response regulator [Desulfovibrionaceae bacterium]
MSEKKKILVVDDEGAIRASLGKLLRGLGLEPVLAASGTEALAALGPDIELVLTDVMMPDLSGYELTSAIRARPDCAELPVILVTALSARGDRIKGVEAGANDFIVKPVDVTELKVRVESQLKVKQAQDALRLHQLHLEETVRLRSEDLQRTIGKLKQQQRKNQVALLDTATRLGIAAEFKDKETSDHIHRMSEYCEMIARLMGLPAGEVEIVLRASPLHDVGKLGTPDAILLKPGPLTPDEWTIMKEHTVTGGRILADAMSDVIQAGEIIALAHHEKWDGSGYPEGLSGRDIPLYGRICAIADVFDALTNKRPYKEAFPNETAVNIMTEGRAKHFDPELLDLFFANFDDVKRIQQKFTDAAKLAG